MKNKAVENLMKLAEKEGWTAEAFENDLGEILRFQDFLRGLAEFKKEMSRGIEEESSLTKSPSPQA